MHLENLSLSFGLQEIFNNVNITIPSNEHIGIVGLNGAGKTTLFKLLTKELTPNEGKISFRSNDRISLLPQIIDDEIIKSNINTWDYLFSGRPILELQEQLMKAYDDVAVEENESKQNKLLNIISKLQAELEYYDVYNADNILMTIIEGVCIPDEILFKPLNTLSGGQKSKVAFARLLYSNPEIILLDEPTNHLDEASKEYVINYLKNYHGSVYVISHDKEFLDSVTNKTLYLDKRTKKMELFNGNYSKFLKLKLEHDLHTEVEADKQQKEIDRLKSVVNLYSNSSGKRKRMAQDREKKLEKLINNKIEVIKTNKQINLNIKMNKESDYIPISVKGISFKYDKESSKNIINNLTFDLYKGEKFLVVGENGVGKSTLLKLIINYLSPDQGEIKIGRKTEIGYYAQEHELLDLNKNIIDNFTNLNYSQSKIRSVLGNFLFSNNDVYKLVKVLSPGERSRVALAKLSLTGANFLILDEPTNHLDPDTQKIIADVFKTHQGTMLVVSHNPEFVDNLGIQRVLILPSGKIENYSKEIVRHYQELNETKK